ncbi:DUF4307 domain-containing protein [Goodfellowiella coeruleoviolacea]|uniref:DUF4307 domain-containing protein n=1 Tax=Goodfellowiella coeruleoviolacea TaxID=334858 RepID=A0AAE3GCF3_9PSEU|nr:DUF4307 domain-containing protein [Goodfellowiella coeruleoviolacea]MCP2165692.1 protein of unknown function (DUF4307) [Goodfellowiella coeruleoviolacea]
MTTQRPAGRYGSRGRSTTAPKWTRWVLLGGVLVLGVVVAVVGYTKFGPKPIEADHTSFEVVDDNSVRVAFEVTRDQPDQAAVCVIDARAQDGDESGRKEVLVPPGNVTTQLTTVLHTSKRAVLGEVFGCSYQVPAYLSTD